MNRSNNLNKKEQERMLMNKLRLTSQKILARKNYENWQSLMNSIDQNIKNNLTDDEKKELLLFLEKQSIRKQLKLPNNYNQLRNKLRQFVAKTNGLKTGVLFFYFIRNSKIFQILFNFKLYFYFLGFFIIFLIEFLNHYVFDFYHKIFNLDLIDIITKIPPFF